MRIVVLAFLAACGGPTETGPYAAVGRVLDASGAPVADQTVESVEGRDVTDAEGKFVVEWKPPGQHLDFQRDGVHYARALREEDVGKVLDLRLPATRAAAVQCDRTAPCDLQLRWDLGDGLSGWVAATCPTGELVQIPVAPEGTPVARCAARPDHPEEEAPLSDPGDRFILHDAPRAVRVEVHAEPGDEPASCSVWVGSNEALPTGDGAYAADAVGRVVVTAWCDARQATPRIVSATGPETVTLEWSSLGPDLDLRPWLPGATTVVVDAERVDEGQGEGGWRLEVRPGPDGVFHLPPLARGTYRISAGAWGLPAGTPSPAGPGVLRLSALVRDPEGKIVGLQGRLSVVADTTEGALRVVAP